MNKYLKFPDIQTTTDELCSIVKTNIDRLERMISLIQEPPDANINQIIAKLERIKNGGKETLTANDITLLSYHCAVLSDDVLSFYVNVFATQSKSHDLMQGLVFSLIIAWNKDNHRLILQSFIKKNHSLLSQRLQSVSKFFLYNEGPEKLGYFIKDADIYSAPEYICLDRKWIDSGYFEPVILAYFRNQSVSMEILESASKILDELKRLRLKKIILPDIVIRADKSSVSYVIKTKLITMCSKMIGDIKDISKWAAPDFNESQKNALLNCRNILHKWQNEKAMLVVFKHIGQDKYPDRLRYWIQVAQDVNKVKMYSTQVLPKELVAGIDESSIGKKLKGPKNAALLMKINDWTIVELLEGGHAFFYHDEPGLSPNMYKYVWTHAIEHIYDLMDQSVTLFKAEAVAKFFVLMHTNCKINHMGEWEKRFNSFLREKEILKYDRLPKIPGPPIKF